MISQCISHNFHHLIIILNDFILLNVIKIFLFRFIGEESTAAGIKCEFTDAPTWIIDPVDGTMNFVHSFPYTCVSIGLWVNKTAEIGIVYNPILDQMFTARKGQGAYLNGEKLQVSGQKGKDSIFNFTLKLN